MVDLRCRWLGLSLTSPLVVGASPIADDIAALPAFVEAGAGAIVLRSVFEEQLVAEQLAAHRFIDSHADMNAEAPTFLPDSEVYSLGPEPVLDRIERVRAAVDVPVVASLNGVTPGGWTDYARRMESAGADALELNLYDVATSLEESGADVEARQQAVVASVTHAVGIPVAVKLSPFYTALPAFVAGLETAGASGVVLFNRFYQPGIDLDTLDVDRNLELSTSSELPLRLHALALLHGRVGLSLAATGGVHTGHDAAKAIVCGASAVQTVSALLAGGAERLVRITTELGSWLEEKGYSSVEEACGATALGKVADPHTWERLNYTKLLQGWQTNPTG